MHDHPLCDSTSERTGIGERSAERLQTTDFPVTMSEVAFDAELAERIRACLQSLAVREVAMFGGRSFMVHEQLAVAAASDGTLLLRCAPDQLDRLLLREGARRAEMRGRPMSPGWIRVEADAVEADEVLQRWIGDALAYAALRGTVS